MNDDKRPAAHPLPFLLWTAVMLFCATGFCTACDTTFGAGKLESLDARGGNVKLPDGFPIASYPQAALKTASKWHRQGGKSTQHCASMTTNDSIDKVLSFYRATYAKNSEWTYHQSIAVNGVTSIELISISGTATICVGLQDGKTRLDIYFTESQSQD